MDEYGEEAEVEEFIDMSLKWGEPDGLVYNQNYLDKHPKEKEHYYDVTKYFDREIDGLRVSSSTDFC